MTKPVCLVVNLPFPGFYESAYSEAVDREESSWLEYHTEDNGETGDDYESSFPDELSLKNDLWDILNRHSDYSAAYRSIAHAYVDAFDYLSGEAFGMTRPDKRLRYDHETGEFTKESYQRPSIGMTFEGMDSPREYNFTTDRVYGLIPLKVMRELFKRSAAEKHETLAAVIKSRFTSYDGFSSFYRTDLGEWLSKPLQEWDHNELGTLLLAALAMTGETLDGSSYDTESLPGRLYEATLGDGGAYQEWSNCVNWGAFDAARLEARVDKLTEWLDEDSEAAREWIRDNAELSGEIVATLPAYVLADDEGTPLAVNFRCPETPDMFPETLAHNVD